MKSDRRALIAFFALTFLLSWAIWVPVMTSSLGWPGFAFPPAGLVGALMPGVAALLVLGFTAGWGGIRSLLKQVLVWRVDVRWYAAALLLVPAMVAVVFVVSGWWRGTPLPAPAFGVGALLTMVAIQLPNTLFEELGWRGFALPRMARSFGWLRASLVLGVIWGAWHLPYWVSAPNVHQYGALAVVLFLAMPIAASVFLAWMYRETGSVLLTWLTHLSINVAIAFMPLSSEEIGNLWPQAAYTVLIVALGVFAGARLARSEGRSAAARPTSGQLIGRSVGG
ncbi:MAG TPA: type II CAAX endopeptidase family protein [Candidatus Dormibacteraeota bacterium]|nr:type II CAAX endopeptidase family protein [Candidatus Dormibacteraeota bacterium]